ncbi:uncharacterized protein Z518_08821 [Rhinocladiella mackenziei CBS 650.93]|uniref:Uncharacterized protein n=1 Tax=Rhinocladiella mackenziei CBS 650.93 TaxID=1442369 RepID=A0A0D2GXH7_9EURO|nr:uncharacterized protein Z518_08821 [Rhinocladiella mackenziei CBS 650.93]KIX02878.1 hypothetical protein Z518_08821 [Rhinocladiella mackenziei CBS 650.93]
MSHHQSLNNDDDLSTSLRELVLSSEPDAPENTALHPPPTLGPVGSIPNGFHVDHQVTTHLFGQEPNFGSSSQSLNHEDEPHFGLEHQQKRPPQLRRQAYRFARFSFTRLSTIFEVSPERVVQTSKSSGEKTHPGRRAVHGRKAPLAILNAYKSLSPSGGRKANGKKELGTIGHGVNAMEAVVGKE